MYEPSPAEADVRSARGRRFGIDTGGGEGDPRRPVYTFRWRGGVISVRESLFFFSHQKLPGQYRSAQGTPPNAAHRDSASSQAEM